jgi:hypothetical protein
VTVAELIEHLKAMPQDATAVDGDDLEVIDVMETDSTVIIWTEQK